MCHHPSAMGIIIGNKWHKIATFASADASDLSLKVPKCFCKNFVNNPKSHEKNFRSFRGY